MVFSSSVPPAKLPLEKKFFFQTFESSLQDGPGCPGPPGDQGLGLEHRGALRFKRYERVEELACG